MEGRAGKKMGYPAPLSPEPPEQARIPVFPPGQLLEPGLLLFHLLELLLEHGPYLGIAALALEDELLHLPDTVPVPLDLLFQVLCGFPVTSDEEPDEGIPGLYPRLFPDLGPERGIEIPGIR